MTVTLRQETAAGTTTKGSALTYAELDNNFIHLLRQGSVTVRGDSGTDQTLGEADKDSILQIAGGTDISTTLSSDSAGETVVTIAYTGSDSNTTYTIDAEADGSNANIKLVGSDASSDAIQLVAGTNVTLTADSAGAITINSTASGGADTQITAGTNITVSQPDSAGAFEVALSSNPTFSAYKETVNILSTDSAGAINVDPADGPIQEITLNENVTFTGFQNAADGQSVTLILKQDGTGSRTFTESLDSAGRMLFAGGTSTLSTAANAIDVMSIVYAGGIYYASLSTNFS